MVRALLLAASMLTLAACHVGSETKDREVGAETSRTYQLAAFDKIEVAGPYDVKVVADGPAGVSASGGENLLDETEVKVEKGVLSIGPKKHRGIRWTWTNGKAHFTISGAALKSATIAGSGSIDIDKVSGDFESDIAGSGDLRLASVSGGKLKVAIAGSGGVKASGTANAVDVSIAGSGDVDLSGVAAKTAEVSIAGSGGVRAKASETADVSIMGSGDVDISGGAKCKISKAGSGNVRCQ